MIDDHLANQYDQPQAAVDRQKSTLFSRSRAFAVGEPTFPSWTTK